jgi:hypothetical protein
LAMKKIKQGFQFLKVSQIEEIEETEEIENS